MKTETGFSAEVEALLHRTAAVLFLDQEPEIIGVVLADLLAMWLASHTVIPPPPGSAKRLDELRTELLEAHVTAVKELVEVEHAVLIRRYAALRSDRLQ